MRLPHEFALARPADRPGKPATTLRSLSSWGGHCWFANQVISAHPRNPNTAWHDPTGSWHARSNITSPGAHWISHAAERAPSRIAGTNSAIRPGVTFSYNRGAGSGRAKLIGPSSLIDSLTREESELGSNRHPRRPYKAIGPVITLNSMATRRGEPGVLPVAGKSSTASKSRNLGVAGNSSSNQI